MEKTTLRDSLRGEMPRLRWDCVAGGVFVALAVQITFGLFGVALGFAARPADASDAVGAVAAIWGAIVPLIACVAGAFVAVRMAAARNPIGAALHGMMVWCVGLIAGAIFLTASLAGGVSTVAPMIDNSPTARTEMANPNLRSYRTDQVAKGAAATSGLLGLSALLGLTGAFLGAALGRKSFEMRATHTARPYRRDERYMPTATPGVPIGGAEDDLPPDYPRH